MTIFSIHTRPEDGPEAIEAVPERFVWAAFLFTPIWALARRAFGFFVLWLAIAAALIAFHRAIGTDAAIALYALFALWSGFAAPAITTRVLERRGFIAHGDLAAGDVATAERVWLERLYGARA